MSENYINRAGDAGGIGKKWDAELELECGGCGKTCYVQIKYDYSDCPAPNCRTKVSETEWYCERCTGY